MHEFSHRLVPESRSLFQQHHAEAGLRELARHYATGRTRANDGKIDHLAALESLHFGASAYGTNPVYSRS